MIETTDRLFADGCNKWYCRSGWCIYLCEQLHVWNGEFWVCAAGENFTDPSWIITKLAKLYSCSYLVLAFVSGPVNSTEACACIYMWERVLTYTNTQYNLFVVATFGASVHSCTCTCTKFRMFLSICMLRVWTQSSCVKRWTDVQHTKFSNENKTLAVMYPGTKSCVIWGL